MSTISAINRGMFTLVFHDQPVATGDSWMGLARAAVELGLATFAFNCLFVPVPGAKIQCNY